MCGSSVTRQGHLIVTGAAQKQAWIERVMPAIEQVRKSVWSVPIDFPDSPIRYTFCYIVSAPGGQAVLIDPGFDSAEGRRQLNRGLELAGVAMADVVGIVVTHMHADHLGMARYVVDQTGAWVGMHPIEDAALEDWQDAQRVVAMDRQWLTRLGVPSETLTQLLTNDDLIEFAQSMARMTLPLIDGAQIPLPGRRLSIIATPGHTPGHICIIDRDEGVLFSGDHVLPRITPNVGLTSTGRNDHALTRYYASLERVKTWRDFEVLAAHEYRFLGMEERAEALIQHQHQRSAEIMQALQESPHLTAWQVAGRLTWARPWSQIEGINLRAALGEVAAHLDHLRRSRMLDVVTGGSSGGMNWSPSRGGSAASASTAPRSDGEGLPQDSLTC